MIYMAPYTAMCHSGGTMILSQNELQFLAVSFL